MAKKYIVDLGKDEKAELVSLTQKGRPGARKIKRANILLLVDSEKPDFEVAELLHPSLAQSHPPNGRVRWTLQLLADRLVALTQLESLSYEAVRLVQKKRSQTLAAPERVYLNCHWRSIRLAHGRYPGFVR